MSRDGKLGKVTREAFLDYLGSIEGKAEYLDGEIIDMAGGTVAHGRISGNIFGEMYNALENTPCTPFTSDQLVEIKSDKSLVFPDMFVVCGATALAMGKPHIITNPQLVFEVLSKETSYYDRGGKFRKYRSIPSLREYVLVDQYAKAVDVFFRTESGMWDIRTYGETEKEVLLQSIGKQLSMERIYRGIDFPEA